MAAASIVPNASQRKRPPPSSPNPTAMVPFKGVTNKSFVAELASNTTSDNPPLIEVANNEQEHFLLFIRVIMK